MFDVNAAFNRADHDTILRRLSVSFGIAGNPLDWLRFFFLGRLFGIGD